MDARKIALLAMLGGLPEGALAQSEQRPRPRTPEPPPYRGSYQDLSKYKLKVPAHEQQIIDKAAAKQLRKAQKRLAEGARK